MASLITWSRLALLVLVFNLFKARWVSSCTLTDFPTTVSRAPRYLDIEEMTRYRREFIICPGAYSGL